jgi:hypothetical protein
MRTWVSLVRQLLISSERNIFRLWFFYSFPQFAFTQYRVYYLLLLPVPRRYSIPPPFSFMDINIIQHSPVLPSCCDPNSFQLSSINVHLPCKIPSKKVHNDGLANKSHRNTKGCGISRRIPRIERMRPDSPSNLTMAIDKCDRKSRPRCTFRCLDTPWPHHRIPKLLEY